MKRLKQVLSISAAFLPVFYTAIAVFFFLPDTVAAHFGVDGNPDRYGSKYEAFILPAVILVTYSVYCIVRRFILRSSEDENSRTERNLGVLDTVVLIVNLLLNALCVMILLMMNDPSVMKDTESLFITVIASAVGVMYIIIGNIMPKTKRNSFIGIRMNFCMDTDEHWYIANRAGGIALVISGVATVFSGLVFRNVTFIIGMIVSLLITLTVATIYSYVIIKKKNKTTEG